MCGMGERGLLCEPWAVFHSLATHTTVLNGQGPSSRYPAAPSRPLLDQQLHKIHATLLQRKDEEEQKGVEKTQGCQMRGGDGCRSPCGG